MLSKELTHPGAGSNEAAPQKGGTRIAASPSGRRIAVIGAGAFGGWIALYLQRRGAKVILLDGGGPANSRSSSFGETRIIRGGYGPKGIYTKFAARALQLWKENEARWKQKLYRRTGVLWLAAPDDRFLKAAMPLLGEARLPFEAMPLEDAIKRYPQINFEGIKWALLEKDAGYLEARRSCNVVVDAFVAEGGEYRELAVQPGTITGFQMQPVSLSDGTKLAAEQYVFACGPWLGKIFSGVLGHLIRPTRQEIFFFQASDKQFSETSLPTWIDYSKHRYYGIPGNEWRGFKLACDLRGPEFDPTSGDRLPSAEGLRAAREYLAFRFPRLKGAAPLEAQVCQYEQSPDEDFIIDRHPAAANAWFAGGGSGHGFKHGPAIGEMVSELVLSGKEPEPHFVLARFANSKATKTLTGSQTLGSSVARS